MKSTLSKSEVLRDDARDEVGDVAVRAEVDDATESHVRRPRQDASEEALDACGVRGAGRQTKRVRVSGACGGAAHHNVRQSSALPS